ncbi:MAG: hypothetical protein CO103_04820 [Chloroflexi bacterium CG_4_9_14_3_um_filter_45_9]|nr:MAG: hypothetical protein AUK00_00600 [Dehalococcoidia bacterium CG2_30_46_9]PIU22981.1 MAG: hypothetical protein COT13_05460 [Chloroflexi bacterium CG08_land_8_20_14_0_20_45_12]PIX27228.1 MAG: hypothetical protein COZ67_03445 [Chloroflexi bacterium CG_4_8_14_3_um_filter_45_15]PJB49586.1 MAG: hypothetical protein CO103_04820 [Chloroflexi bacterium CG_4_9_14_3_um_filter_45_9]
MRKMTVVFDDDALYTTVKVEAARRNQPVKKLVSQALREWLEAQEDAKLLPEIEKTRAEWQEKGGIEANEFFAKLKAEAKTDAP